MKKVQVSLNSIDKVKSFVKDISDFSCDFDLISGRYVIDAKSHARHFQPWIWQSPSTWPSIPGMRISQRSWKY